LVLTNQGGAPAAWNIVNLPSWLSASPSSGTLAGNTQTTVTVSLTAAANGLASGTNSASLLVTNLYGVVAALPFTLGVGGSIVNNGGFETGDFTGWTLNGDGVIGKTIYDGVASSSTFAGATGYLHSGTYGAILGESPMVGYLNQTLTTAPGQSYLVSLWFANPTNTAGASPSQFLVQWNGTTIYNQTNLPFSGWTNLLFTVTAASASTVLQFGFEDTPYYLALDDISVTPVASFKFRSVQRSTASFNLAWNAVVGQVYQVQYATSLAQPNWINLGGQLTADASIMTVQDTNAVTGSPSRFYRIVQEP
jgi:hypothetical protein